MSQLLSEAIGERRASPRQRRLNGAKIIFNANSSVINCVVVDLSPEGARLRVASPVGIPDWVDLRIDQNGACFPSKVAWRSANHIGVTFLRHSLMPEIAKGPARL
jgi:PilZ domain